MKYATFSGLVDQGVREKLLSYSQVCPNASDIEYFHVFPQKAVAEVC